MKRLAVILQKPWAAIALALVVGFLIGLIVLAAAGYDPFVAYGLMFGGIFSKPKLIAQVVVNMVPLVFTGLSVAFAFRTGLFNIGAEGQFQIGALVGAMMGHYLPLPTVLHPLGILLCAFLVGGAYGALAAYLKNRFGIHEVISTIMLNWMAFYFNNYMVSLPWVKVEGTLHSPAVLDTARITFFSTAWRRSEEGRDFIKGHPVLGDIMKTDVGYGILLALLASFCLWFLLRHTKQGFELRAVGQNPFAALFSGIPVTKNILRSMFVAGGVAALGGAVLVLSTTTFVSVLSAQEGYGWDGISVSLIASSNPLATPLAAFLFATLRFGGSLIQSKIGAPTEIINIMIGAIVLSIALAPALPRLGDYLGRRK